MTDQQSAPISGHLLREVTGHIDDGFGRSFCWPHVELSLGPAPRFALLPCRDCARLLERPASENPSIELGAE
jgi:hypothetical protein